MSLIHDTFTNLLLAGTIIEGLSVEYGDDFERDFIIFHVLPSCRGTVDVIVDSIAGDSRLVEIQGDLSHLIDSPVTAAYAESIWHIGEMVTNIIVRTALGEVTFIWSGYASDDVEARTC